MNLFERIRSAKSEEELRELNDKIVKVGEVGGMEAFRPLQVAYLRKQGEIRANCKGVEE